MIVSWSSRRGNQSILKEISPEYSLEGLMLELKLQYFGHLMQKKTDSLERPKCWESLIVEGQSEDRMSTLDGISDYMYRSLSKGRELVMNRETIREFRQLPLDETAQKWKHREVMKFAQYQTGQITCLRSAQMQKHREIRRLEKVHTAPEWKQRGQTSCLRSHSP